MQGVISRLAFRRRRSAIRAAALAILVAVALGGSRESGAQGPPRGRCPGVADLLSVSPSQDIHLDVLAYDAGALSERLRLCRDRAGGDWFDPAEEGRRQAMGLMFEWAGVFSCALSEYASAPSALSRPLRGPRVNYLREAMMLEAISGSYEAESDLRASPPLDHFRALQLQVKIQSRWNRSTDTDQAELSEREARGDVPAAIAMASLIASQTDPVAADRATELFEKAGRQGSVQALELGADYAGRVSSGAGSDTRTALYRDIERTFLVAASYRGSLRAMETLVLRLKRSTVADDAAALGFWESRFWSLTRDLNEITSACR